MSYIKLDTDETRDALVILSRSLRNLHEIEAKVPTTKAIWQRNTTGNCSLPIVVRTVTFVS